MLSEEMMYYINMAVGDGKLESKELEFLKQKAAELGANPIEVEITATTLATQAKKHVMMEKTHCPNCGSQLNQMTGECEYCNFSFDDSGDSAQFSQEEFSQQTYKEHRIKEIVDKPLKGLGSDIIMLLIFIGIFLSLVRPPRKSPRQKQLEAEILMYPIPKQQKVIFDLCIQLASQVEPVNKVLCFINTKEKEKVQNNAFLTKKIMQVYQKAKLIFRKEPKILEQLKNLLQTHNITV